MMEGDGEIEEGGANVVNVMLKFSCSHYVNAKTKTSENKDKHIWTGIRMVLEALNGKIQQMGGESAHSSRPSNSAKDSGIEYEVTYEIPFQSARVEVKNRSIYSLDSHEDHVHHLIPNDFHKVPKVCNHVAEAEVRRRMMPATVASDIGEPLLSGYSERRAARKNLMRKAKIPLPVPVHSECDDHCPTSRECDDHCPTSRSDSPPKLMRPDLKCVVVGAKSSSFSSPTAGSLSAALSEVNRKEAERPGLEAPRKSLISSSPLKTVLSNCGLRRGMASSESLSSAWDSGQEDPSGHRNRRSRHLRKTRVSPQMHTFDGSEPMTAMGPDAVRAASIVRSSVCDNCSVSEKGMSSGTVSPVLGLENAEGTRAGINGQSKRVVVPPLVGKGGTALGSTGEPARNGPSETASTAPPSLARLLRALAPTVWGRGARGAGGSMDLVSGHSKLGNRNK
eukprot:gene2982-3657_t